MKLVKNDSSEKNKKADFAALKWVIGISKGSWLFIFIYAILSAALSFFSILTAFGVKDVVNGASGHDMELLKKGAVLLLVLIMSQMLLRVFNNNLFERTKAKIEIKIRSRVFERILKKDYYKITSHHSGDLLNRLNSDVQTICNGITGMVPNIVSLLTRLISAVVFMISLDPFFAGIFLVGGLIVAVTTRFFRNYLKTIHKQVQRIAIARAILHNAPVLLLDEATSALDEATEEKLLRNLRALDNRTCIIITHKPAALNVCNKEIRIEDKKIKILETKD